MTVKMKVVQGKPRGSYLDFPDGEFVIGRGPECHVRPNSELISRQHCLLRVSGGAVLVRDLGSTNGTLVNGRLLVEEFMLSRGDTLQLGSLVLEVCEAEPRQGLARNKDGVPDTMDRASAPATMDHLAAFDAGIQNSKVSKDTVEDLAILDVGTDEPPTSGSTHPAIGRFPEAQMLYNIDIHRHSSPGTEETVFDGRPAWSAEEILRSDG